MNRRESLKFLATGALAPAVVIAGCGVDDKKAEAPKDAAASAIDRMPEEAAHEKKIRGETFFTPHEMATIGVLADIIIPKDDVSGSATEAKVPAFIEFIVKDMPHHQTPMRGGLRWLDTRMLRLHGKPFKDCSAAEQLATVDAIAYPDKAKPDVKQGVAFFSLMRNLTASGFYTSEIGVKDLGYLGNKPNQWNGVPDEVLKKHGLAYTEKELRECVSFSPSPATKPS